MKGKIWDGAKWLWKEFGDDALALGSKWIKPASQFASKPPANVPKISISKIEKIVNRAKQQEAMKKKLESGPDWSGSHARHSETSRRIKQELDVFKEGRRPAPGRRGRKKSTEDSEPKEITGFEGKQRGGPVRKKRYAKGGGIRKAKLK